MSTSEPLACIAGSNIWSASGPASSIDTGATIWAIMRRAANTRPCTSGATFDCQIAWLDPLRIGADSQHTNQPSDHSATVCPTPTVSSASDTATMPSSTP